MTTSFENAIKDLIGDSYEGMTGELEHLNASIRWMADAIPTELLLKYTVAPANLNNDETWLELEGKKVLKVLRRDGASGDYRLCREVNKEGFDIASDSESTYEATKYSPIFTLWSEAAESNIYIHPVPTSDEIAKVYYFIYPTTSQLSQTGYAGLPPNVEMAVVYKTAISLLQNYVKTAVQDDEDSEILTMLAAQVQSMQTLFQQEMATMTDPEQDKGTE